jgi:Cys-tRNA(Pro)/Cys-tRNA(Cys) deacylase
MLRRDKTQAMRALDAPGIAYDVREYNAAGAFHPAEEAAALLGVDQDTVYKTLVVLREDGGRKPLLVMVPVTDEIDLRVLVASVGAKKPRMARQADAERLTGMRVGGISALSLREPRRFEVLLDERGIRLERIHISAGRRGVDLGLAVRDLIAVAGALVVRTSAY